MITRMKILSSEAPSTRAASSSLVRNAMTICCPHQEKPKLMIR